jgi:hypothetical protein
MPKNIEKYDNERKNILNKLYEILEITDINKQFSLKELDNNIEKQQKILQLEEEIKKYFVCSRWCYFSQKCTGLKRNYLSLIKSIFKALNIKMLTTIQKGETNYILI